MSSNYREYAYDSAQDSWATGYLLEHVVRVLGAPQGKVLDLGCGNGGIARQLLKLGHDVYGVDASESGIAIANRECPGRFFVADLATGMFPSELAGTLFTTVISTEVIEHLYRPKDLIELAQRLLAPGGRFVVSTPYHGYAKNLVLALTGKLDDHFTALWDGGHIKFFSRKTLSALLTAEGFEDLSFAGAGRFPYLWKSMLISAQWPGRK